MSNWRDVFIILISTKINISLSYKVNFQITSDPVRLIGPNGEAIGVTPLKEAQALAARHDLDLVEVSPTASPPVCKIANYSKMKYEAQKKELENRKKSKKSETKELRFGANIAEHDCRVKVNHAHEFIEHGDKVRFIVVLRGRQNQHKDLAIEMLEKLKKDMLEIAKLDSDIKVAGNQISMTFAPKK